AVESNFEAWPGGEAVLPYLPELVRKSRHPILSGLLIEGDGLGPSSIEEVPGQGILARTQEGVSLLVGRAEFVRSHGVELPSEVNSDFPVVAYAGKVAGQIIVKPTYDDRAKTFLKKLLSVRPKVRIEILSGDPVS